MLTKGVAYACVADSPKVVRPPKSRLRHHTIVGIVGAARRSAGSFQYLGRAGTRPRFGTRFRNGRGRSARGACRPDPKTCDRGGLPRTLRSYRIIFRFDDRLAHPAEADNFAPETLRDLGAALIPADLCAYFEGSGFDLREPYMIAAIPCGYRKLPWHSERLHLGSLQLSCGLWSGRIFGFATLVSRQSRKERRNSDTMMVFCC